MNRALQVISAIVVTGLTVVGCASDERPELVPGSTIATSSTTTAPSGDTGTTTSVAPSATDAPSEDTTTTTSLPRLDPEDPGYPTTSPPAPRPTVSYPTP